jgi:hypothetical protein
MERTLGQQDNPICNMHGTGETNIEAATNMTIKTYKAMNDWLRFENEAIKACCESQGVQQTIMHNRSQSC